MRRRSAPLLVLAVPVVVALVLGLLPAAPAGAIVGGDPADPDEWPWQVSLQVQGSQFCGGSLLSYSIVLTAAHCTDGMRASDFTVVAGTNDIGDRSTGQHRRVTEIRQNEQYDPFAIRNDISLLFLDEPFDATDHVQPVSIPDPDTEARLTAGGDPAIVTGFGATNQTGPPSDRLLEADIEIVDDQRCFSEYGQDGSVVFPETEICAGRERGHVGSCFGDSGGPLVVPAGTNDDEWLLVGIVSWGAGCAQAFRPTVFTEVTAYIDWLAENGAAGIQGTRFDSEEAVRIPAVGSRGKAGPYPATVDVEGVDTPVQGVAVELRGLSHAHPEDLDIWLEAPDGTVATVLSDVGGTVGMDDRTIVVAGGAPAAGTGPLAIQVGPTDVDADPQRGGDPPAADFGVFDGVDADGTWRLLIADDEQGGAGALQGWTLILR